MIVTFFLNFRLVHILMTAKEGDSLKRALIPHLGEDKYYPLMLQLSSALFHFFTSPYQLCWQCSDENIILKKFIRTVHLEILCSAVTVLVFTFRLWPSSDWTLSADRRHV